MDEDIGEAPDRDEVIALLAAFGQRSPDEVAEEIGSLELTWLVTKVEVQYGVTLDLSDETLAQMTTVTGAVSALRDVLTGAEHG
jgi:acyl carrier protein